MSIDEKNLKQETLNVMKDAGKDISDIDWIESLGEEISNFWEISDIVYNCGYGTEEIETSLVIVFKDGSYLNRREYDGSEWWEYNKTPTRPTTIKEADSLISKQWWRR